MRTIAAVLFLVFAQVSVAGSAFSTDHTDIWWNANESGEGFNIIDQHGTLFMTFFVYGTDGKASWYVAPDIEYVAGSSPNAYMGSLYQTNGPWFGGAFDPKVVGARQVGSVTFTALTVGTATLSYIVDGVIVAKSLTRQTWRTNDPTGDYYGGFVGTFSNCAQASLNGHMEQFGDIAVSLSGSQLSITATIGSTVCTYFASYEQDGHFGNAFNGTYSCLDGTIGNFQAFEIETSISGITGRAISTSNACAFSGRFGGVRRGTSHL